MGLLFFSLAVHRILQDIRSEFVVGYLDDVSIRGGVGGVVDDVRRVEESALGVGLTLNHSKSEIIGGSPSVARDIHERGLHFTFTNPEEAVLLGAPLHEAGVDRALGRKLQISAASSPE